MRNLFLIIACLVFFFTSAVKAQEYPEVSIDSDEITLSIPYLEFDGGDGETRAMSAELVADNVPGELSFKLNESSLEDRDVDTPAAIEGEGACSRTTNAQLLACRADKADDFFEQNAKCFNFSDAAFQAECLQLAEAERSEGLEECEDIEEVHENLCSIFGEAPYDPVIDPANFVSLTEMAANPNSFFPLVPGNVWEMHGGDEVITVTVLNQTRKIMGVDAVVVQDIVQVDGVTVEDTFDWYGQDKAGNVWYMGELSRNYEDGEFSDIDGSWEAGVDGAKPGILFRSMPIVGETLRQEYRIGEAEDIGETLSLEADELSNENFACASSCLEVLEYTPLDPEVAEKKYYRPGVGNVLVIDLEDNSREVLVKFLRAN